jgi:hypothetical protein
MCQNPIDVTTNISLLIQQYRNTVRTKGLIMGILQMVQDQLATPMCQIQDYYNIDTAVGVFLDRIGRIFNYPRPLIDQGQFAYFGFDGNGLGFDQATFVPDGGSDDKIPAGDDMYRLLLKAWIAGLFTDGSLPSINAVIQTALGPGSWVIDNGDMTALVTLKYSDLNVLYAMVQTGVIPKPAGVQYSYYIRNSDAVFGFDGNGVGFDQSNFITELS